MYKSGRVKRQLRPDRPPASRAASQRTHLGLGDADMGTSRKYKALVPQFVTQNQGDLSAQLC